MKEVKVSKSVITSIKTNCPLDTRCLTENVEDMNKKMEDDILNNENEIAMGLKRAQSIQAR